MSLTLGKTLKTLRLSKTYQVSYVKKAQEMCLQRWRVGLTIKKPIALNYKVKYRTFDSRSDDSL